MPFLEMPTLTGALATVDGQIDAASTQGHTTLTAIESRDSVLLQPASERMDQHPGQARTILAEGSARISALLMFVAVGRLSLVAHAWSWMRGRGTA